MKKIISFLLCLCMVFGLMTPVATYANVDANHGNDFAYQVTDGYAWISDYLGDGGDVVVPAAIDGYPVKGLLQRAFYQDNNITSITLAEGVETAKQESIAHCSSLKSIHLPSTYVHDIPITRGEGPVITHCPEVETITVADGNTNVKVIDNALYTADMTYLLYVPSSDTHTVFEIPEGVVNIWDGAFEFAKNIEEIIMPDTVEVISYWAFNNAESLKKLNISENCTLIGQFAINGTDLKELHIPASVKYIYDYGIWTNQKLEMITVAEDSESFYSVDGVLYRKGRNYFTNALIAYPAGKAYTEYTVLDGVQEIAAMAFSSATNLREVVISNTVTTIGRSAFFSAHNLRKIYIPASVTDIDGDIFSNCYYGVTIYGTAGSYAQEYAQEYGFRFVVANAPADMDVGLNGWHQASDGNWYYYRDGNVDTTETGLIPNGNEVWYAVEGKADFTICTWANYNGETHYVMNGKLVFDLPDGLYPVGDAWYYFEDGVYNYKYTGLVLHGGVWFYVEEGRLDWNYTGLVLYNGVWFYVQNGSVAWDYAGLVEYGGVWFYVSGGSVQWNYTGLALHAGVWFYIENGSVNWTYRGLTNYNGVWFFVENGSVNWNYNSLVEWNGVWFYVSGGSVQWNYAGLVEFQGIWFYVTGGSVNWTYEGWIEWNGVRFYIKNGTVDWNH